MSEERVYEYFKMSDFYFTGSQRDYVEKMWTQNQINDSYFARLVDLYAIAAVVGLRLHRRLPAESTEDPKKRTVQLTQIAALHQTLIPIMKLVLLLDDSRGLSAEQRIESAFRNPESKEEYEANMELFNSYVRGGTEFLYQQLILRTQDEIADTHEDNRINNILALLKDSLSNNQEAPI